MIVDKEIAEKLAMVVTGMTETFPRAEMTKLSSNNDRDNPTRVNWCKVRQRSAEELE